MNYNKKPDFHAAFSMILFLILVSIGIITYKKPKEIQARYYRQEIETDDKFIVFHAVSQEGFEKQLNEFSEKYFILDYDFELKDVNTTRRYWALVRYREK